MTLAAALRSEWLIPKGHDWLAVIAFLTLCSGLVRAWVQSILSRFPAPPAHQSGAMAVTSVSTIISGKARAVTPISVWTGSGAVPKFRPRHWP